jgi:vacuolar-type H+-ATPase subunit D/Vma8
MNDAVENLVLEHLRHIRAVVDDTRVELKDLKGRVGIVEEGMALLHREMAGLHTEYAHVSVRLDRVDNRLERIERRLDLVEV